MADIGRREWQIIDFVLEKNGERIPLEELTKEECSYLISFIKPWASQVKHMPRLTNDLKRLQLKLRGKKI